VHDQPINKLNVDVEEIDGDCNSSKVQIQQFQAAMLAQMLLQTAARL